jgi:ATP-dependent protease Clp ATPase subunit
MDGHGESPALSALPRVGRFVQPDILIGRDQDLTWLQQAQGDALLVGPPGSGKTYLHQHLASQGKCLFAVDSSPDRLADAIREQQP